MAQWIERVKQVLAAPLHRLLDIGDQAYWVTYAGALLTASLFYAVMRKRNSSEEKSLLKLVFPRDIWQHPSTRMDMRCYVVSSMYLAVQGLVIAGVGSVLSFSFMQALHNALSAPLVPSALLSTRYVVAPVMLYLALEFGYWFAHYLMHRVPWLWECHKVHHSAEVMTPLTEWRQHPVEYMVFPLMIGIAMLIANTVLRILYGAAIETAPLWVVGFSIFVFNLTIGHLRHSHVKLHFPDKLNYIFVSPPHHHIHHSTAPEHFDKNLGYSLVLWDWVFGTLYLPTREQNIAFGLPHEKVDHRLIPQVVAPFRKLWKRG